MSHASVLRLQLRQLRQAPLAAGRLAPRLRRSHRRIVRARMLRSSGHPKRYSRCLTRLFCACSAGSSDRRRLRRVALLPGFTAPTIARFAWKFREESIGGAFRDNSADSGMAPHAVLAPSANAGLPSVGRNRKLRRIVRRRMSPSHTDNLRHQLPYLCT